MILNAQARGQFQLFAASIDELGVRRVRKLTEKFDNLITDEGMDRMGTTSSYLGYCHVGAGTAEPEVTDIQLASRLGWTGTTYQADSMDGSTEVEMRTASTVWGSRTKYYQFPQGAVVGNVTEIGVSGFPQEGASYPLFSRTLIKDTEGNPTSVTVLESEYLYVAYTLTVYIDATDVTGTFVFDGDTYNYTSGLYRTAGYTGSQLIGDYIGDAMAYSTGRSYRGGIRVSSSAWAGGRTSTGTSAYTGLTLSPVYVPRSFVVEYTVTAPPTAANGPWYGLMFDVGWMNYRIELDGSLSKSSDYTWSMVVRQAWSRYTP